MIDVKTDDRVRVVDLLWKGLVGRVVEIVPDAKYSVGVRLKGKAGRTPPDTVWFEPRLLEKI
jgi:hypothetical protein